MRPQDITKLIAEWVSASWARTKEETVHNSRRHALFSFFPDEPTICDKYESNYDYSSDEEEEGNEDNGEDVIEPI